MTATNGFLPPFTVLVEWENAIDVEDHWAKRAMSAFEHELEINQPRMTEKPRVMYLYDSGAVEAATIQSVIDAVAPRLKDFAEVELVPTPGLTYYKLKNFGVSRTETELVIMLDSDAGPQPGWLDALLKPFQDPDVMAVGGFTVLGHEDFLSRAMALSWIFNLPSERKKAAARKKIFANNCAFRTDFFRRNPWPDLPAFKKQCGFWIRDIEARGVKWVRTVDAMTVHAPHPGYRFLAWRAWTTGLDRDFQTYHTLAQDRRERVKFAFAFFKGKIARAASRIYTKGHEVNLPNWQRPLALLVALGFYLITLTAQLYSALALSFEPLPEHLPNRASAA